MSRRSAISATLLLCLCSLCTGEENSGKTTTNGKAARMVSVKDDSPGPVAKAIASRRSVRCFTEKRIPREQIARLLWAAQGITDRSSGYRAAPSAGATYPLSAYAVTEKAIERYVPGKDKLDLVKEGDFRDRLAEACHGQPFIRNAPVVIVLTAVYERTTRRYGERGIRYVHMEAGHAAQNVHLQAVALGLGSVPVGAFNDRGANETMGCGEDEEVVYVIPAGKPCGESGVVE